jgi:glucose dehydrogenase
MRYVHPNSLVKALFAAAIAAIFPLSSTVAAQQARVVDANILKAAGTANDSMAGSWLTYGLTQGETRFSPLK